MQYENTNGRKGRQVKSGQALRQIIDGLIHIAINSNNDRDKLAAISLIADRIEGKAVQALIGDSSNPITVVQRVIVQQSNDNPPRVINGETVKAVADKPAQRKLNG